LPLVIAGALVLVCALVLAGGAAKVPAASKGFRGTVDKSYAAQASVLVDESNLDGEQLTRLLASMVGIQRSDLQSALDGLALSTSKLAASASEIAPPGPTEEIVHSFVQVMTARAKAIATIRHEIDGLLGISGPSSSYVAGHIPAPQSAAEAVSALVAVGAHLRAADRSYDSMRLALGKAPGAAKLPASVWVDEPAQWGTGSIENLVTGLTTSSALAPVIRLTLLQVTTRTGSALLPAAPSGTGAPPTTPASSSGTILPTHSLDVTAVVANQGNVAVSGVTVTASAAPSGSTSGRTVSARVDLAPGTSESISMAALPVLPGHRYSLTVAITPPPGQTNTAGTSESYSIRVAPDATAPTTTTTTTTTPHHPKTSR
jgi:hypothetical protein